jgi:diguanylate cyclase (GGDEF)-like protein/PAS domain S-box-containing protein
MNPGGGILSTAIGNCPFCDSAGAHHVPLADSRWAVHCPDCGATGPIAADTMVALAQWSKAGDRERLLRCLIDESPDYMMLKNWDGKYLVANRALAELYGTTPEQLVGRRDEDFNPNQEQVARYRENEQEVMRSGALENVTEMTTHPRTGVQRYLHAVKQPLTDPEGEPRIVIVARDVTDMRTDDGLGSPRDKRYAHAMAASGDGIWDWDMRTDIVTHNVRWCVLMGQQLSRLQHPSALCFELVLPEDRAEVEAKVAAALAGAGEFRHEYRVRRPSGDEIWVVNRGDVVERDGDGRPIRMVGSTTDFTEFKRSQDRLLEAQAILETSHAQVEALVAERTDELRRTNEELSLLARNDALTGLPNRMSGNEQLEIEFNRMHRTGEGYSVLMMDLDWFKRINDSHGHANGDSVLQHIAEILQSTVRDSDFVARFGGEEFMALLPATGREGALLLAEKVRLAVESNPVPQLGAVTVSVGVATADITHTSKDLAVQQADSAMYQAKANGRNLVVVQT